MLEHVCVKFHFLMCVMIDVFVFVVVIENDSLHMSSVQITAAS